MKDCLLLVDPQNDYVAGGTMELVGAEQPFSFRKRPELQFKNLSADRER